MNQPHSGEEREGRNSSELDFRIAAERFFQVLFKEIPEIKDRFRDKRKQKRMFASALQCIHNKRGDKSLLSNYLMKLGEKHRMAGVSRIHMRIGRKAFEQAVEAGGENLNFSSDDMQFYLKSYDALVVGMGFNILEDEPEPLADVS
jgi:hypothetical protein